MPKSLQLKLDLLKGRSGQTHSPSMKGRHSNFCPIERSDRRQSLPAELGRATSSEYGLARFTPTSFMNHDDLVQGKEPSGGRHAGKNDPLIETISLEANMLLTRVNDRPYASSLLKIGVNFLP